jgi:CubicO group peptidase (beta-lactamase class C family)
MEVGMNRFASKICLGLVCLALITSLSTSAAKMKLPPPGATDPVKLGLMKGFPVPPAKQITFRNFYLKFPNMRWAFHHMRELVPTADIWRGPGPVSVLKRAPQDLGRLKFKTPAGKTMTIAQWLTNTFTDAFLVLYKGKIVYERYFSGMKPQQPHICWSVTKSFTGLLVSQLIAEGKIDPQAKVAKYVPELAKSAWGDATVQQTLNMTTAVLFREIYTDPKSEIYQYAFAAGILPMPKNYPGPKNLTAFLVTLKKKGNHGEAFHYRTVNSEVLGWILRRVTGKPFARLMSERIWGPMGAEFDAYVWLDSHGAELMGAGLNATLRDLARVGEMIRRGGMYNGRRILAKKALAAIFQGGDPKKFKKSGMTIRIKMGYTYRNQWWVMRAAGVIEALGIHGQMIHVNPAAKLVVVKFSSHPVAGNAFTIPLTARALKAIGDFLNKR